MPYFLVRGVCRDQEGQEVDAEFCRINPTSPELSGPEGAPAMPALLRTSLKSVQVPTESVAAGDTAGVVNAARALRVNCVNVPVRVLFSDVTDSTPEVDPQTLAGARAVIEALRDAGDYLITLEPYPWIANGTRVETDYTPSNPAQFFTAWRDTVLTPLAQMATELGCEGMYVCSALEPTEVHEAQWNTTIDHLAARYAGAILYRTKWWVNVGQSAVTAGLWSQADRNAADAAWRAKLNRSFWGNPNLHVISIQGYWELTTDPNPTLAHLKAALRSTNVFGRQQDVVGEVRALAQRWGKPVFFGELGCAAAAWGAYQPWSLTPNGDSTPSPEAQANFYRAHLETFSPFPWWLGYSVWQAPYANLYNPVGRAAEAVIRRHRRLRG